MAVSKVTLSPVQAYLKRQQENPVALSAVEKNLAAKKEQAKNFVRYDESEDFFKMKAFELKRRLVFYQNMGMQTEASLVEGEAAELIKKYQKLYGKIKTSGTTTNTTA